MAAFAWVAIQAVLVGWQLASRDQIDLPNPEWFPWFVVLNWAGAVAVFLSVFALASAITIWWNVDMKRITKIKFTLVGLACVFLTWFAQHWHLIGPAHRI